MDYESTIDSTIESTELGLCPRTNAKCDINSPDKAMWAGAANSKGSNSSQFMHRILSRCKSRRVTAKYRQEGSNPYTKTFDTSMFFGHGSKTAKF